MFEFGFKKHAHTLSVPFRTSQRLYLVSRGVDKKPHSLVCQLILVKKKKKKERKKKNCSLAVCVFCLEHTASALFHFLKLRVECSWICIQMNQTPLEWQHKGDLGALDATDDFSKDNSFPLMLIWDAATVQVCREELPDGYLSFFVSWSSEFWSRKLKFLTRKSDVDHDLRCSEGRICCLDITAA